MSDDDMLLQVIEAWALLTPARRRMVMAILRGDRDGAAATMRAHIRIVSDEYWEYAKAV